MEKAILKTVYPMDAERTKVYSIFYKGKGFSIETDWQYFGYCKDIEEMHIVLDSIGFHDFNDIVNVIRWAKKENRRIAPLTSIRGMEWDTPASRQIHVIDCVCNRMDGLKPKRRGKITEWVQN